MTDIDLRHKAKEKTSAIMILLFGITVLVSAFLLFQVQPVIAKFILPWYGGTPSVWTTCMLMFQLLLLGGYLYAHILTRYFKLSLQVVIHIVVIASALFMLPVTPGSELKPEAGAEPFLSILKLLALTVGAPYFVLSATGPLLQKWFSNCVTGKSPYRLYALSNLGSVTALVSYPFVIEPWAGRVDQTRYWSMLMIVFGMLCILCAGLTFVKAKGISSDVDENCSQSNTNDNGKISKMRYFFWMAFPAIASIELLAVTNKITQDIAAVPFLWILPLSIYLLTFIICFDSHRHYYHSFNILMLIACIAATVYLKVNNENISISGQVAVYSLLLLFCAMLCHGQLYYMRPDSRHLTSYYLMISLGGVLGGFFVAVLAPLLFKTFLELNLGLLACILLTIAADIKSQIDPARKKFWVVIIALVGLVMVIMNRPVGKGNWQAVHYSRNFFGGLTVWLADDDDPQQARYILQHGTTYHGVQFVSPAKKDIPTAYYNNTGGVGKAMELLTEKDSRNIGVIGLGVGTVAAYGKPDDRFSFYEINPDVVKMAEDNRWFSYLSRCKSDYDIFIGDARLVMEAQSKRDYDLLIVDAFSSDSVPVHLLTVEAMNVYLNHLDQEGIIAFHLSNNHLDLPAVVLALAENCSLSARRVEGEGDFQGASFDSNWVLLSRNAEVLNDVQGRNENSGKDVMLWTDDHVNLFEVLK